MKKQNYLYYGFFLCLPFLFSCERSEDIELKYSLTALENSLDLKAPSGILIAESIIDLKDEITQAIRNTKNSNFEITDIKYFPLEKGYIATIEYLTAESKVGSIVKTHNVSVEIPTNSKISNVRLKSKTSSESDDDTGLWFCERVGYNMICLQCNVIVNAGSGPDRGKIECECKTDCMLRHY